MAALLERAGAAPRPKESAQADPLPHPSPNFIAKGRPRVKLRAQQNNPPASLSTAGDHAGDLGRGEGMALAVKVTALRERRGDLLQRLSPAAHIPHLGHERGVRLAVGLATFAPAALPPLAIARHLQFRDAIWPTGACLPR